LIWLL
jgi:accA: acetyl-CoA carboxylase, carboxyl transferase, alpha subunit